MMDTRQLEYFVAVAEELNFTRAAKRFNLVPSALSYQIARLEEEEGITFFERASRSVRLSAAGELLLPRARALLRKLEVARLELKEFSGAVCGKLRIGIVAGITPLVGVVERALVELHIQHPGVDVVVDGGGARQIVEGIASGELDVGCVDLPVEALPPNMAYRPLIEEPFVAIAPLSQGETSGADLRSLARKNSFVDVLTGSESRRQVDALFARAKIPRRVGVEVPTTDAVVRMVVLGIGAAVVPAPAVANAADSVQVLSLSEMAARYRVGIVSGPGEELTPSARALFRLLAGAPDRPHGVDVDKLA